MRFDIHCHTKEGSLDARVSVVDYARLLQKRGFAGMLTTDHNSYKGYYAWCKARKELRQKGDPLANFVVLKGIEYDTLDAGHILVVMPKGLRLRILEVRGLPVHMLIKIVHQYGGILGPAHPYGAKFLSAMCSKKLERTPKLIYDFDFIEAFNTCEKPEDNQKARALANAYQKPAVGGSDSHKTLYIGTAYTDIHYPVRNNDDFIYAVKNGYVLSCGGEEREKTNSGTMMRKAPVEAAWKLYNRGLALAKSRTRKNQLRFLRDVQSLQHALMNKTRQQKEREKEQKKTDKEKRPAEKQ